MKVIIKETAVCSLNKFVCILVHNNRIMASLAYSDHTTGHGYLPALIHFLEGTQEGNVRS